MEIHIKEAAWHAAAAAPGAPDLRAESVATEGGACGSGRWARSWEDEEAAAAACSAAALSAVAAAGGMAWPPLSCGGHWPSMAGGQWGGGGTDGKEGRRDGGEGGEGEGGGSGGRWVGRWGDVVDHGCTNGG